MTNTARSTRRHRSASSVPISELPKGPNGRALCRQCEEEVPKGRRSFCSDGCVEQWVALSSPAGLRWATFKRDQGVCAMCGVDVPALETLVHAIARGFEKIADRYDVDYSATYTWSAAANESDREWLWTLRRDWKIDPVISHWQADHIIPVVEGGGECTLDNIRTLCTICHLFETRRLHRRLAFKRRFEADPLWTLRPDPSGPHPDQAVMEFA